MQPNRNEKYLLRFIACQDTDNGLLEIISKLGLRPRSREYNPVYQIIDELTYYDVIKEKALK